MTDKSNHTKKQQKEREAAEKKARLAQALRTNLRRRKGQDRARTEQVPSKKT